MELSAFIEEVGDEKAAKLFGVKVRTAASWRRRERIPRPKQVPNIVRASKGKVTLEGVYPKS
jgi:DNA-binding transcriptional regulator YdaS (Cro superfamily)